MSTRLKIYVACGGTGGHIFPGIATGRILLSRSHAVTLLLAGKNIETVSTAQWDGSIITIPSQSFSTRNVWRLLKVVIGNISAILRCYQLFGTAKPDVLLAMGSYSSVAPVIAAYLRRIPIVLHESNAIPGRANTFLSRLSDRVALHFPSAAEYFPKGKAIITGMPLRQSLILTHRPPQGTPATTLLIMGGSQGAHRLNIVMLETLKRLHSTGIAWKILHLSGKTDEVFLRDAYTAAGINASVFSFTNDMANIYSESSFAVCRSGAATCAELAACGTPSLLVPYPEAARDHQKANANAMKNAGAADVVDQIDLSPEWLASYLTSILSDPLRLESMRKACAAMATPNGSEKLADAVEQLGCH